MFIVLLLSISVLIVCIPNNACKTKQNVRLTSRRTLAKYEKYTRHTQHKWCRKKHFLENLRVNKWHEDVRTRGLSKHTPRNWGTFQTKQKMIFPSLFKYMEKYSTAHKKTVQQKWRNSGNGKKCMRENAIPETVNSFCLLSTISMSRDRRRCHLNHKFPITF